MSEENWKLEKDLCRCCLNEGSFKNLAEPCLNQGEEEIYSEMLLESLDINLVPVSGPLCSSTYTICEECILRLRDACSFKRQVLLSEKRFRDLYRRDVIELNKSVTVKHEESYSDMEGAVKLEVDHDDDNDDFKLNYDDDNDADNKIDIHLEPQAKKPRTRKPKAKEKPKPTAKKRGARPRKLKAEVDAETTVEAEAEAENKAETDKQKKDGPGFTAVADGLETAFECGPIEALENENDKTSQINMLNCDVCNMELNTRRKMLKHLQTHGIFKCPECSAMFGLPRELTQHKKDTHKHVCEVCDMQTICQETMFGHLRKHGIFKCDECYETLKSKTDMIVHKRTHIRRGKCTIDHGNFTIADDGVKKKYICHQCGQQVNSASEIKAHINRHESKSLCLMSKVELPKEFVCDYCGIGESTKSKIGRHIKMRHTPVKCTECGVTCANSYKLDSHTRLCHPQTMICCGVCSFKCFNLPVLNVHIRKVHMGEKNVPCPQCDMRFFSRYTLKRHLIKHNPVKNFECRFCKKKFPRSTTRLMHEKIHLGHKNKVCSICDARFVQKASLNYHMKKYHPDAV